MRSALTSIRALPNWAETAIVVLVAFAPFIYSSTLEIFTPSSAAYSQADFAGLTMHEIVVGTLLMSFLIIRGWRFSDLGFAQASLREVWQTPALFVAVILISGVLVALIAPPTRESADAALAFDEAGVSIPFAIVFSLINAMFEEVFVCAYLVAALRFAPGGLAILLSALLRLSYHLYQGPLAVAAILPLGLLFAAYFASQRRVAPLIAVHAALDLLAFAPYLR